MGLSSEYSSLLEYYQKNFFNPVPISIENRDVWENHVAKRRNLYDHHLGIPIPLFRDRSVIEFGCNSGENSLVLAQAGANLTLVEPNEQVVPRLRKLFEEFGLIDRISSISNKDMTEFETDLRFDLAIAEGFLFALPDRDEMVGKMCELLSPGGVCVISFNDRYGVLIEIIKRMYLWRACQILSEDAHGEESLNIAVVLFGEDFEKLNKSRPLAAWWKDMLVQPYIVDKYFWSYQELIPLIEKLGMELLSCSPRWVLHDSFNWYKNRTATKERHKSILDDWRNVFPFILTGRRLDLPRSRPASDEVVASVADLIARISSFASDAAKPGDLERIIYPDPLDQYLNDLGKPELRSLNQDIKKLFETVKTDSFDALIKAYQKATSFRSYWGTPYHYISCVKSY